MPGRTREWGNLSRGPSLGAEANPPGAGRRALPLAPGGTKHAERLFELSVAGSVAGVDSMHLRPLAVVLALSLGTAFVSGTGAKAAPPASQASENPLAPPDTSSPRATLQTFVEQGRAGWRIFLREGLSPRRRAQAVRAIGCLDLSEVPVSQRDAVGLETAIMLLDVFNRIPLPRLRTVPDADDVKREELTRWVLPGTPIAIARVAEGPREGEWLFTPEVVQRTREFYRLTRSLPLKQGAVVADGYRIYSVIVGWMIPEDWVSALPAWATRIYFEQTVFQWILLALLLVAAGLLAWLGVGWSRRAAPGETPSTGRKLLGPGTLMVISAAALYLISDQVHITGTMLSILWPLVTSIFFLSATWGVVLAGQLVTEALAESPRFRSDPLNAQLARFGMRLASIAIAFGLLAAWALALGIPVVGVITGLGVGGIAVALAAQRTVENFIGSLTLFVDHPVRVGDFCRFGDKMGIVERIGLQSTQIRTLERSVLSIPNAEFSRLPLDNLTFRDRMLFKATLNLRLESTTEQIQRVLSGVRDILLRDGRVDPDPARIELVAVGPCSLDLEIFAYVKTNDWGEFLAIRKELLLRILGVVEEAGTALAPPAQTTYLRPAEATAEPV